MCSSTPLPCRLEVRCTPRFTDFEDCFAAAPTFSSDFRVAALSFWPVFLNAALIFLDVLSWAKEPIARATKTRRVAAILRVRFICWLLCLIAGGAIF